MRWSTQMAWRCHVQALHETQTLALQLETALSNAFHVERSTTVHFS
jgi:hypothetical protein